MDLSRAGDLLLDYVNRNCRPHPLFEPAPPERDQLRIAVTRDPPVDAPADLPLRFVINEAPHCQGARETAPRLDAAKDLLAGFGELRRREVNKSNGVFDSFAVVDSAGTVLDRRWEWAGVDPERDRIVFTQDCVLHAVRLGADELGVSTPLFDSRPCNSRRERERGALLRAAATAADRHGAAGLSSRMTSAAFSLTM